MRWDSDAPLAGISPRSTELTFTFITPLGLQPHDLRTC
jgi:hypothetical protein